MAKKLKPKKKKVIVRGSNRYRDVQKILSGYTKSKQIKLGKDFNKAAGEIYRNTQGSPLKHVQENMDRIYLEFSGVKALIEKEFPDDIPFYNFLQEILSPIYDGVVIGIKAKDSRGEDSVDVDFKGYADDVESVYKESVHAYCRKNYNDSPVAYFKILDTDNKTFVDYELVTDREADVPTIEEVEENVEKAGLSPSDAKIINAELEILREKNKLLQSEERVLIERRKNADKALELIKAGFTKDEAMKILGL